MKMLADILRSEVHSGELHQHIYVQICLAIMIVASKCVNRILALSLVQRILARMHEPLNFARFVHFALHEFKWTMLRKQLQFRDARFQSSTEVTFHVNRICDK